MRTAAQTDRIHAFLLRYKADVLVIRSAEMVERLEIHHLSKRVVDLEHKIIRRACIECQAEMAIIRVRVKAQELVRSARVDARDHHQLRLARSATDRRVHFNRVVAGLRRRVRLCGFADQRVAVEKPLVARAGD
jgi:hypothetical protein